MYFHNSLIPSISEVKVNQLKVKNMHVKMGISTFNVYVFEHLLSKTLMTKPFNYGAIALEPFTS